eukprot:Ihof_evm1s1094 gene=Ihof_evmTU1s1094
MSGFTGFQGFSQPPGQPQGVNVLQNQQVSAFSAPTINNGAKESAFGGPATAFPQAGFGTGGGIGSGKKAATSAFVLNTTGDTLRSNFGGGISQSPSRPQSVFGGQNGPQEGPGYSNNMSNMDSSSPFANKPQATSSAFGGAKQGALPRVSAFDTKPGGATGTVAPNVSAFAVGNTQDTLDGGLRTGVSVGLQARKAPASAFTSPKKAPERGNGQIGVGLAGRLGKKRGEGVSKGVAHEPIRRDEQSRTMNMIGKEGAKWTVVLPNSMASGNKRVMPKRKQNVSNERVENVPDNKEKDEGLSARKAPLGGIFGRIGPKILEESAHDSRDKSQESVITKDSQGKGRGVKKFNREGMASVFNQSADKGQQPNKEDGPVHSKNAVSMGISHIVTSQRRDSSQKVLQGRRSSLTSRSLKRPPTTKLPVVHPQITNQTHGVTALAGRIGQRVAQSTVEKANTERDEDEGYEGDSGEEEEEEDDKDNEWKEKDYNDPDLEENEDQDYTSPPMPSNTRVQLTEQSTPRPVISSAFRDRIESRSSQPTNRHISDNNGGLLGSSEPPDADSRAERFSSNEDTRLSLS